jgi:hypothetical protein
MRDPNSGQGWDPEGKPRHQYRVDGWLLKTRRLPPASVGDRWQGFIDAPWWEPVLRLPPGGIILDYWQFHAKDVRGFEYSSQAESAALHVAAYTPNGREVRYVEGGGYTVQPENDNYWLQVPDLETAQVAYHHPEQIRGIDRPKTNQGPSALPDNALRTALEAQNQSDRAAKQDPGSPMPPEGYPAIPDVTVEGNFGSAKVLGYHILPNQKHAEWYYHGQLREPGDGLEPILLDATMPYLTNKPIPAGWERKERTRTELYARLVGNPILLEQRAQALDHRYRHALATAPGWLFLAELQD